MIRSAIQAWCEKKQRDIRNKWRSIQKRGWVGIDCGDVVVLEPNCSVQIGGYKISNPNDHNVYIGSTGIPTIVDWLIDTDWSDLKLYDGRKSDES